MSDDIGRIKSVQRLQNINHLTVIDKDRRREPRQSHEKKQQQDSRQLADEVDNQAVNNATKDDVFDGHSIDVKA